MSDLGSINSISVLGIESFNGFVGIVVFMVMCIVMDNIMSFYQHAYEHDFPQVGIVATSIVQERLM